jgi:RNA polymerase sigma-70 factor (ECF subfamily)
MGSMISGRIDELLDRLNAGDRAAVQQIFLIYEPYLRMVVRRRLPERMRSKFDSADVVLSAWADLWDGFRQAKWKFTDADQLRAFLVKVTCNRLIDRIRRNRRPLECEHSWSDAGLEMLGASSSGSASEIASADELWQQMLEVCPPQHRKLLHLRRQGISLAEIAERTRLHESSVRRILHAVHHRLALKSLRIG